MASARKKIKEIAEDKISPYRNCDKPKKFKETVIQERSVTGNNLLYGLLLLYLFVTLLFIASSN